MGGAPAGKRAHTEAHEIAGFPRGKRGANLRTAENHRAPMVRMNSIVPGRNNEVLVRAVANWRFLRFKIKTRGGGYRATSRFKMSRSFAARAATVNGFCSSTASVSRMP